LISSEKVLVQQLIGCRSLESLFEVTWPLFWGDRHHEEKKQTERKKALTKNHKKKTRKKKNGVGVQL